MANQQKCALTVCTCLAAAPGGYCGEYCQEAAAHGVEKDFCQCAHAGCASASKGMNINVPQRPPGSEERPRLAKAKHA